MIRWFRRLMGEGESYDEAYARIAAEIERDYPIAQLRADTLRRNRRPRPARRSTADCSTVTASISVESRDFNERG